MNRIKKIINWINWHIGGLRHPDAFFRIDHTDPVAKHIQEFGFDEPTLN